MIVRRSFRPPQHPLHWKRSQAQVRHRHALPHTTTDTNLGRPLTEKHNRAHTRLIAHRRLLRNAPSSRWRTCARNGSGGYRWVRMASKLDQPERPEAAPGRSRQPPDFHSGSTAWTCSTARSAFDRLSDLFTLQAHPITVVPHARTQDRWDHRHAARRTDRWVLVGHPQSRSILTATTTLRSRACRSKHAPTRRPR
jgi:hypothetical protein